MQIPGYVLGVPTFLFFAFLGTNEYLFAFEVGKIAFSTLVAGLVIYKVLTKKTAHILFWCTLFAVLYDFIMILGGYFFLGWMTLLIFAVLLLASFIGLRKTPVFMRIGIAYICLSIAGAMAIKNEREFEQGRCEKLESKRAAVFSVLDDKMHAYDFAETIDPPRLTATFSLKRTLVTYDPVNLKKVNEVRVPMRGVQRITPHPDGRYLFAATWGQWEGAEAMYIVNPETGRPARYFKTPGCRNAFEVIYDERRARFYLICEASHNLLAYDFRRDEPFQRVLLSGLDTYDAAMGSKGEFLYITDWLSPKLTVLELDSLAVEKEVDIGWTSFGVVSSPDGRSIFVARPIASEVVRIDTGTLEVADRIEVGFGVRDLDVDPKRNLLFAGNYFDGTLDVVDIATGKRLARHYAGRLLRGLYYHRDTDRLFLATGCGILWADVEKLVPEQ